MKKLIFSILFVLLLTGCAEVNAIRQSIGLYGSNAADQTLDSAIWTICSASPVGAINRRFRTDAEKSAWREICPVL